MEEVYRIRRQYEDYLLSKPYVVGVGVGHKVVGGKRTEELAVVVSVVKKVPQVQIGMGNGFVPQRIEGVATDVQEVGYVRALQERTDRWRPAPGGVSIGHVDITAGTLGCLVQRAGQVYILSNNHVLANSNRGQLGDSVYQPGPYDQGGVDTEIATLADFVPISIIGPGDCDYAGGVAGIINRLAKMWGSSQRFKVMQDTGLTNLVDAALARPVHAEDVIPEILLVGRVQGVAEVELGMEIIKSGRTTGVTRGTVTQVEVTMQVAYPPDGIAIFDDQFVTAPQAEGGDSGSLGLDSENRAVGLLFAGSEQATIFNRIQNVAGLLGVEVV